MDFTIVTPSYNQVDWLRLCVASVRDQVAENAETLKTIKLKEKLLRSEFSEPEISAFQHVRISDFSVEHIIQDAGTPGIEDFACEIGADFYRDGRLVTEGVASAELRVVREKNVTPVTVHPLPATRPYRVAIYCERDDGMYDAINRGLARATGELCAYLNCDEQYLPGALCKVSHWFADHPLKDVVFADAVLLDLAGQPVSYRRTVLPDRWHTRLCHLNTLTCSTFFRKKVFLAGYSFPIDRKVIGDGVWVDSLLQAKIPMGYLKAPTSTFTFTGQNLSELDIGPSSEQAKWARSEDAPPYWLKTPVSCWHRFKKLLYGAYKTRNLDTAIYTMDCFHKRHHIKVEHLGSAWPSQT